MGAVVSRIILMAKGNLFSITVLFSLYVSLFIVQLDSLF